MSNPITLILLCTLLAAFSVAGGFFAGKSVVFERILNDKIECSLTVNPITQEQLK